MHLEGTHQFGAPRAAVWEALLDPTVLSGALPGGEQLELVAENQYRAVMNVKVGPVQGRFEGKILLEDIVAPERYTMKVDGQGAPGFVAGEGQLELLDADDGGTLLRYAGDVTVGGRIAGVGQRLIESTAKSVTRQGLLALDQMIQARLQPAPLSPAGATGAAGTADVAGAVAVIGAIVSGERTGSGADLLTPPLPVGNATYGAEQPAPLPPGPGAPPSGATAPAGSSSSRTPAPTEVSMASIGVQVAKDIARDIAADYIGADKQEKVLYFSLGALAMLLFVVLVRLVQKD